MLQTTEPEQIEQAQVLPCNWENICWDDTDSEDDLAPLPFQEPHSDDEALVGVTHLFQDDKEDIDPHIESSTVSQVTKTRNVHNFDDYKIVEQEYEREMRE